MKIALNPYRPPHSRTVRCFLAGLATSGLVWACFTPINSPVQARGIVRVPADPIRVISEIGGRIRSIHIQEGSEVQAGSILVQLDDRAMLLKKRSLESRIHFTELHATAFRADLAALYAGLEQTRLNLDRLTITSPAGGQITSPVLLHAGETIPAGTHIATLRPRSDNVVIECRLSFIDRIHVIPGQRVRLRAESSLADRYEDYAGSVLSIAPDARILISPAGDIPGLRIGVTLNVHFGARRQYVHGLLFDILASYRPAL